MCTVLIDKRLRATCKRDKVLCGLFHNFLCLFLLNCKIVLYIARHILGAPNIIRKIKCEVL